MSATHPTTIRRKSRRPGAGCTIALVLVCLTAAAAAWGALSLLNQTRSEFGAPYGGINPLTRFYYSARLLLNHDNLLLPSGDQNTDRIFEIRQGESVGSIAYRLEAAGLVPDADSFRIFLIYSGIDRRLQAGKYKLTPANSPVVIAQKLQDATPAEVIFAVLPGWRLEEVAASLPTTGLSVTPEEFILAANRSLTSLPVGQGMPETTSMEGFLLPGEYLLPREADVDDILGAAVSGFLAAVPPDVLAGFEAQGLSLYQAVTLASMVEREAIVDDEQPMIASVFYNRLADTMKLDSDPTVQYAAGFNSSQQTWWTNPLSAADLQIDSPYNTYLYQGLPPTPIANPGLPALRAVAFPASSPYYYFRAKCDGSGRHAFAVNLEQHMNNACQ